MNFYSLGQYELENWLLAKNYSIWHGKKIFQHFYKHKKSTSDLSSAEHSFPKNLIIDLINDFDFSLPKIIQEHQSSDATYKLLLEFEDKKSVEVVIIPFHHRHTICLSTQVGCAMKCSFCYTGTQGLTRHLHAHEIVGLYLQSYQYFEKISGKKQIKPNIVFMGQGEPLHNFEAVKKATEIFLETFGLELGPRNITLSTAGYLPGLKRLHEFPKINLALSLHSAFPEKRSELIPLNKTYPLSEVLLTIKNLPRLKRQFIMCEYLLIDQFNDSDEDAAALIEATKELPVIVNLIPFNPFPGSKYKRPKKEQINYFKTLLEKANIPTLTRTTKGDDILAACGQLYVEELARKKNFVGNPLYFS